MIEKRYIIIILLYYYFTIIILLFYYYYIGPSVFILPNDSVVPEFIKNKAKKIIRFEFVLGKIAINLFYWLYLPVGKKNFTCRKIAQLLL